MQRRPTWVDLADACVWELPDLRTIPGLDLDDDELGDLVCAGADLDPATLARAYSIGLFPMPDPRARRGRHAPPTWWSPVERGVLGVRRAPVVERVSGAVDDGHHQHRGVVELVPTQSQHQAAWIRANGAAASSS